LFVHDKAAQVGNRSCPAAARRRAKRFCAEGYFLRGLSAIGLPPENGGCLDSSQGNMNQGLLFKTTNKAAFYNQILISLLPGMRFGHLCSSRNDRPISLRFFGAFTLLAALVKLPGFIGVAHRVSSARRSSRSRALW
jgi:hypothetical protein